MQKVSQVINNFAILGSTKVKAACKHVGEIDPKCHDSTKRGKRKESSSNKTAKKMKGPAFSIDVKNVFCIEY